ncbi:MAG: GntR family transcriptional regulator, partial [Deltaproteobacteria bacterium]|nr:GntR family transcriptional regulator [Deltaproteobacteria bacterium]
MSGLLSLRKTWQTQCQRSELEESSLPPAEPAYLVNPIQTPTAQELVYKELERALVTARIKPGERLMAKKLSRQMGISVIPIREAMGRLEARNFLT